MLRRILALIADWRLLSFNLRSHVRQWFRIGYLDHNDQNTSWWRGHRSNILRSYKWTDFFSRTLKNRIKLYGCQHFLIRGHQRLLDGQWQQWFSLVDCFYRLRIRIRVLHPKHARKHGTKSIRERLFHLRRQLLQILGHGDSLVRYIQFIMPLPRLFSRDLLLSVISSERRINDWV